MFVEYATSVDAPLAVVERRLDRLRSSLEEWADVAYREGEHLRARVGPRPSVAFKVSLDIGSAEIHKVGLVYPLRWTATEATVLFPELNADLILSKVGSHGTTLTLRGTYDSPLGALGRLADRAVLRHVAEATVTDWVERLADALSADVVVH
jgi:hypothetical protein